MAEYFDKRFNNCNYIYDKSSLAFVDRNDFIENMEDFTIDQKYTNYEAFVKEQVVLYWPRLGLKENYKIISRQVSIYILQKIINDRRIFDGYFRQINARPISMAVNVYEIMQKAARVNIPVDAIAHRIFRFKKSKKIGTIYDDLKNIMVEYRAVLDKYNLYDIPMLMEIFNNKLAKDPIFIKNMKAKTNIFLTDNIFIDSMDIANSQMYEQIVDLRKIKRENFKVLAIDNLLEEDSDTYFSMLIKLEECLLELVKDKKIDPRQICVVYPKSNPINEARIREIEKKLACRINYNPDSKKFYRDRQISAIISALMMYEDLEYLMTVEEKVNLLDFVFSDKNRAQIRENIEEYMRDLRSDFKTANIIESLKKRKAISKMDSEELAQFRLKNDFDNFFDELEIENSLLNSLDFEEEKTNEKKISNVEFLRAFYKIFFEADSRHSLMVNNLADLLKELNEVDLCSEIGLSSEDKYSFVRSFINTYTSNREKKENVDLADILMQSIEDYLAFPSDRKILIIFDATSKSYDLKIENEIDCDIAYFKDQILTNINDDNYKEYYRDLVDEKNKYRIESLLANRNIDYLYLLSSEIAMNGFDQDNNFKNDLLKYIKRW